MAKKPKESGVVSQISLVQAIAKELKRQGYPNATQKQLTSIIDAANLVCDTYRQPVVDAAPAMGLAAWLMSDATGLSSLALARRLQEAKLAAGGNVFANERVCTSDRTAFPHDPSDFKRCTDMLAAAPELRQYLEQAVDLSPVWARLISMWPELEATLADELPSGTAPRLYAMLKSAVRCHHCRTQLDGGWKARDGLHFCYAKPCMEEWVAAQAAKDAQS